MDNLTKTQRRRLKLHIFGELTYSQIAVAVKNLEK